MSIIVNVRSGGVILLVFIGVVSYLKKVNKWMLTVPIMLLFAGYLLQKFRNRKMKQTPKEIVQE